MEMTICWAIWQRSGYGNSLHHLPIINTPLQQAIDQHAHNTTDISRHYLERALQGHFSEPICQLLAQLVGSASAMTIASCAEQVMQFGATSGVDCLAGMLHGFRTLNTMN